MNARYDARDVREKVQGPLRDFYPDFQSLEIDPVGGIVRVYESTRKNPVTMTINGALNFVKSREMQRKEPYGE